MGFMIEMDDDDLHTLQCAVENMRSADGPPSVINARWRLAFKLEKIARDAAAASRLHEQSR